MDPERIPKEAFLPVSLYQSLLGRYFVGYADEIEASIGFNAWAGLFNPLDSGRILHVNVVTVTNVQGEPFNAEFWLNSRFPGTPVLSELFTPANTTITPPPRPSAEIRLANQVPPIPPAGGVQIYSQLMYEASTIVYETDGRYLLPPGGSMTAYLNLLRSQTTGRVAFGWWEENIPTACW